MFVNSKFGQFIFLILLSSLSGLDVVAQSNGVDCDRFTLHKTPQSMSLSYQQRTEQAIQAFVDAAQLIKAGNSNAVFSVLNQVKASLCELQITSEHYRKLAEQRNQQCSVRAEQLNDRVAWLYRNEQINSANLKELAVSLENAMVNADNLQNSRNNLLNTIGATITDLETRRRRLDELNKWWWVPGYGQYLAIRELVEKDSAKTDGLIMDLKKYQQMLAKQSIDLNEVRSLHASLKYKLQNAEWSGVQLLAMRDTVRDELGESKSLFIFLADAEKFWEMGSSINLDSIDTSVRRIESLLEKLKQDRSVRSLNKRVATLAEQLTVFANRAGQNSQFFLDESRNHCSLTEKTNCPAGYTYDKDNQFCWINCPSGYAEETASGSGVSATCRKPDTYSTKFHPQWESRRSFIQSQTRSINSIERMIASPTIDPAAVEILKIQLMQAMAFRETQVKEGLKSCIEVNGNCKILGDGLNWQPVCKTGYQLFYPPRTRQYPSPPPQPPNCFAMCPQNMLDLGTSCGKQHAVPF